MTIEGDLQAGQQVERYRVEACIGKGGFATVYRVRHVQLGGLWALKVLNLHSPAIRRRFVREGRVQCSLRHPNIVGTFDIFEIDGAPALVMEYVNGPSLDEWLEERLSVPFDDLREIFAGILSGLEQAHTRGIIHRDLKPANVLMEPGEGVPWPRITDFGMAKALQDEQGDASLTQQGAVMGTPAYMSPEQIEDAKEVDARSDLFSLGCMLYEMFIGRLPFSGTSPFDTMRVVTEGRYVPPRVLSPRLPEPIEQAIVGCLQTDRDARIPDCGTLRAVLEGRRSWKVSPARAERSAPRTLALAPEETGDSGSADAGLVPTPGDQAAAPLSHDDAASSASGTPVPAPGAPRGSAGGGPAVPEGEASRGQAPARLPPVSVRDGKGDDSVGEGRSSAVREGRGPPRVDSAESLDAATWAPGPAGERASPPREDASVAPSKRGFLGVPLRAAALVAFAVAGAWALVSLELDGGEEPAVEETEGDSTTDPAAAPEAPGEPGEGAPLPAEQAGEASSWMGGGADAGELATEEGTTSGGAPLVTDAAPGEATSATDADADEATPATDARPDGLPPAAGTPSGESSESSAVVSGATAGASSVEEGTGTVPEGKVTVEGNILGARLVGAGGEDHPAGVVPAGTYTLHVAFPNGSTIVVPQPLVVEAGQDVSVRCDERAQQCR